jgi:hypothetical protein
MRNTSPAQIPLANIPMWLYELKNTIHQNLSRPNNETFHNSTRNLLPQLINSKADLRLLQMRLLHALLTGPHFPAIHLQSQTWCVNTIITFIENLSEGKTLESSFDDPSDKAHQTASAHFTTAHALMAARHAAECAAGKNDDAIVSAFTSLAAATVASGQDAQDFWLWAVEVLVNKLQAAITVALANIR